MNSLLQILNLQGTTQESSTILKYTYVILFVHFSFEKLFHSVYIYRHPMNVISMLPKF